MRIVQVVTLVTPDGGYGGPLRVALNQVTALREAGHQVLLAAGAQGFGHTVPRSYAGVPVHLFPAFQALPGTGFAGLIAPTMIPWLRRAIVGADVMHVHFSREFVGLGAAITARAHGLPYVLQTHGMIDPSDSVLAAPLDRVVTRRLLREAEAILSLTPVEDQGLLAVEPGLRSIIRLHNGVPDASAVADTGREPLEVLYLARLAPRKRPVEFVKAAQVLAREHPDVRFTLVGPDEGEEEAVRSLIRDADAGGRIAYEGALPPGETMARMARASIYVLPSVEEPYPMSVLEAMSIGLPCVVLDDCGLADAVSSSGGEVVTADLESLIEGIGRLLRSRERRAAAGRAGSAYVQEHMSMHGVRRRLESVYSDASGSR